MSGKKSCQGKVSRNCSLQIEYLPSTPFFLLALLADLYSHAFKFAVSVSRFCLNCSNCTKFGQLILWKIIKIVANRRHIATVARGDTPSIFP